MCIKEICFLRPFCILWIAISAALFFLTSGLFWFVAMSSENPKSLASTLERPESFDDWLLGTHYSQKYMATLRLMENSSPIYSIEKKRGMHAAPGKQRSRIQRKGMPYRANISAKIDVHSMENPSKHASEATRKKNVGMLPPCDPVVFTGRKNNASLRGAGATESHVDEPVEVMETRDLLRESYYRIKNSCTGVFPALLTPYQRSFWSYKTVNDHQSAELPVDSRTATENNRSYNELFLPPKSQNINDIPLNQRAVTFRRHPPTGPPLFAPTPPSYKWLKSMR
ncbi:hypothetical protein, conserved [Trypanosoma cruzi]|uniref:Uncharacterized protein n=2 Tax=Trypanosoma cruzi TaxID=5693 RepID=Q4DA47_TRYCC|nr:hypothetical protein, conserved [Trypanosoma cruzi]EAN89401.1 hypothetical protein, conserved [Trypanosoma cruzi]|eukprot:XP_811252.1 hypothetical protein [Trypanosoma cruzi strain CL Brener]